MAGHSLRPVLDAGAHAVLVPYTMEWVHERVAPQELVNARYH